MPSHCVIPSCNANYTNDLRRSVFRFPKNEDLKEKWRAAIPRKNLKVTKYSRVCEFHFTESDFIKEACFSDPETGKKLTSRLSRPRLKEDAVPSQFTVLSPNQSIKKIGREHPDQRRKRLENKRLQIALKQSLQNFVEKEGRNINNNVTLLIPVQMSADILKHVTPTSATGREWKKDEITALIALYQKETCLYDQTHLNYYDLKEKNKAYQRIQSILRNFRQNCSVSEIENKIKSLHTQYVSEKSHKDSAIQSGDVTEHSYEPVMWCFGLLQFLDDHIGQFDSTQIKTEVLEETEEDRIPTPVFNYDNLSIKVEREDSDVERDEQQQPQSFNSSTNYLNQQEQLSSEFIMEACAKMESIDVKPEPLEKYKDENGRPNVSNDASNNQDNMSVGTNRDFLNTNNEENFRIASLSKTLPSKRRLHIPKMPFYESDEREDIFGEYIASEMKILRDNSVLYLETKQAIIDVLTSASFEFLNAE